MWGHTLRRRCFLKRVCWRRAQRTKSEHTVARRMGEVCQKTGDPVQFSGRRSKTESSREASRSTRLRLPTASWALCILPCSRWVLKLIRGCGLRIVPGESSMECGGTRGCHTRSNGHSFAALFAVPPSRASLHFPSTTETTFDCRDAWRKSSALSC